MKQTAAQSIRIFAQVAKGSAVSFGFSELILLATNSFLFLNFLSCRGSKYATFSQLLSVSFCKLNCYFCYKEFAVCTYCVIV